MKLRRALAILAFLAVAILPVVAADAPAAAPAFVPTTVVTGDLYSEAITDGTVWGVYGDWNIYINAAMDACNNFYINFGRKLYSAASFNDKTATTALPVEFTSELVNLQYMYAKSDVAKFFAMEKMLTLNILGGYYYTTGNAYENKDMTDSWVRLRQRTTESNWWLEAQLGLPGLFVAKAGIAPVSISSANYTAFSFTNDWMALVQTNQTIPDLGTFDAEVGYYGNKQAIDVGGVLFVDGDAVINAGMLKASVGAGIEYNVKSSAFTYGATARATYYLDDKKTTFAGAGFGVKGTPTATTTNAAFSNIEIDVFCTPIAMIDIKNCTELDLASSLNVLRSCDTAICVNLGSMTDLYVGYLISNNTYTTKDNASDNTFVDTTLYTITGNYGSYIKSYVSAPYVKLYVKF